MCLSTIDEVTEEVTEGWKIFSKFIMLYDIENKDYEYLPLCQKDKPKKTGEWVKDVNNYNITSVSHIEYKTGFHFYFTKSDAKAAWLVINHMQPNVCVLKKVKVRNIVATGLQKVTMSHNLDTPSELPRFRDKLVKVGVAREMFIEE